MRPYKVTIRSPQGKTSYNAIAVTWFECFMQASSEFGVRAIISVVPA